MVVMATSAGDLVLPILLALLGAGGLGSLLVSRLVPQRRSPDQRAADDRKAIEALDAKVQARDDTIDEKDAIIRLQADYIVGLRLWGSNGSPDPMPGYPDNLKIR